MMRKKTYGIFFMLVAALLSALCMTACAKRAGGNNDDGMIGRVAADSIVFTVTEESFTVSWQAVESVSTYEIKIDEFIFVVEATSVDLYKVDGLTLPSGSFDFNICTLYKNGRSDWTVKTYVPEEEQLQATLVIESLQDSVLKWNKVKDAIGYRVVDIDFNVTEITTTSYDMFDKNLVLGVYPVKPNEKFDITQIVPSDIKYLDGDGTAANPYLIKSPFDLRAIDYYETRYFNENKQTRNNYKIANDLDYSSVNVLEGISNMYTLHKPFFGTLDGDGKKLSNVYVNYDGGYWAMFDFLSVGSSVKNIVFENPEIENKLQVKDVPINASIATVAYRNYGTVSAINVKNAKYTAAGGEVSGIVLHNYGTVENCEVSGTITQGVTGQVGQACYEMAGVVLENCKDGKVTGNKVTALVIAGSQCSGDDGSKYYNVRTAGGIVSVNRTGGTVSGNSYTTLTMTNMLNYYNEPSAYEWGGIVAYNANGGTVSGNTVGSFKWNGANITRKIGDPTTDHRGTLVGKNDASSAS